MDRTLQFSKFGRAVLLGIILSFILSLSSSAVIRTSSGTSWTAANFGGTLPATGDTIVINSNMTGGPASTLTFARLVVNSGFTFTHNTNAFTISGGLLVNGTYQLTTVALTVNGSTTINGTLADNSSNPAPTANLFAGSVSINSGGNFSHTAGQNPAYEFRAGIVNNGTLSLPGTGVKLFSTTAAQSLSGTGSYNLSTITINTGVTLTNNYAGVFTFSGVNTITGSYVSGAGSSAGFANGTTLGGAGSFTIPSLNVPTGVAVTHSQSGAFTVNGASTIDGTWSVTGNTGLKLFADALSITAGGSLTGAGNAPFEFRNGISNEGNLSLSGTGIKTFSTINQALAGSANISLSTITVAAGITLTNNSSGTLNLSGVNTINGTLTDGADAGSNVFSGTLNTAASGTFSNTTASATTFSGTGGIGNSGSISITGAGAVTFSASQTVSGAGNITLPVVNISAGVLTVSNTGVKQFYGNFNVLSGATLTITAGTGVFALVANLENAGTITSGGCPFSITGFLNSSAGTITIGTGGLTVAESVSLTGNSILNFSTGNVSITGSTTLSGTAQLTDGSSNGANVFGGLVTIGSGCSMSTTLNSTYEFRAGIACDGTVSLAGTGAKSFSIFNQNLSGAGSINIGPLNIPAGIILTNNNTGTCTFGSSTAGTISGTLIDGVDGGINALTGLITIAAGGTISSNTSSAWNISTTTLTNSGTFSLTGTGVISITGTGTLAGASAFTLENLTVPASITFTLSNSAAKSITGNCTVAGTFTYTAASGLLTIGGNLGISGIFTNGGGGTLVNGSVDLSSSGNLNANNGAFTAGTTCNLTGTSTFTDGSATATNTFVGMVNIASGCSFTSTSATGINFVFRGGITNDGTFNLIAGTVCTFNTNNQTLQGSNAISLPSAVVAAGITLSSSALLPVTFGAGLTLAGTIDFTGGGTTTLNNTAFSGAGSATFQTLILVGGTISQTGALTVLGSTSVQTTSNTISSSAGLKSFNGLLSIPTGLSLTVSNSVPLQFQGGISCAGTFNQTGSGVVTFSGSQSIDGAGPLTFTGAVSATQNLMLSKTAGTLAFVGSLTTGDTLYLLSATTATISGVASLGSFYSTGSTTMTIGANNFTVNGSSNIGGLLVDGAVGGTDTFTGAFAILAGGELREFSGVSNSNWTFGSTFNNAGTFNNTSNGAIVTFNGNVVNTGTFIRTNASAAIILNNNISFTSSNPINITSGGAGCALTINGNATMDLGANSFTIGGDLNVNSPGSLSVLSTGAFTVSGNSVLSGVLDLGPSAYTATGNTTINASGSITDGNDAGTNTFTGLVTLSSATASFTSANASPYSFAGGITNAGSLNLSGTGTVTFNNTQTVAGAGSLQLQNFTVPATRVLTISATGTKSVSGDVTNAGTITHSAASGTLSIAGTMNNSGTITGGAGPLSMGVYSATGALSNGAGGTSVSGAISLSGTANINLNNGNFSALSTTSLTGSSTVTDGSTAGSNLFTGILSVGAGCSFTNSLNSPFEFRGGIQHDGSSFSLTGTGAITFSTNNQTLFGSSAITLNNANIAGINLTNFLSSGVTVVSTCTGSNGSSQWIQGSNGVLNFQGTSLMPTGIFSASASGNTVNYSAGVAQNIKGVTYFNLGCLGSNTKTLTQNLTCGNDLNIIAGVTFQAATFNVLAYSITNAGTFSKTGAGSIFAGGPVTLNGTGLFSTMSGNPSLEFQEGIVQNSSSNSSFGAGTAVFSTNDQTISGTGTGAITFGGNVQLNDGITLTNQKTVSITGNLDASSGSALWNNANGSVLNYAGTQMPFNTSGSLIASTNSNTVNYNGAAQTIRTATYHNLSIAGSGAKILEDVTINGNFTHTAGTITASGTQAFAGSTAATLTSFSTTLNVVTINKTGSSLNLVNNLNIADALSVISGSLVFGSAAKTLTVNGDLMGSGNLDMSGNASNVLALVGSNNAIGSYTSVAGNTVTYSRSGNQTLFSSPNYRRLSLNGAGLKSLSGNVSVSDTLYFLANVLMDLGSSNLTLNAGSRIRSGASGTNAAFSSSRMILTGGSGVIIRKGNSASDFTGFAWSNTGKNAGLFPVGTTGLYSPCEVTALTATVAGTGSISVNAIATKLPAVPFYFNSLAKYWELSSSNLSGISANMRFTYNNPAEVVGNQALYVPRIWDGSSLSAPAGASAIGSNPISTTGSAFITGQWTAVDVTPRNAYYTYISGEWNDPNIWTTDPSGSTRVNEKVPEFGDQVFILNGDTVTNLNGDTVTIAAVEIENGAVLDLGSTTSHSLGPVSGTGTLRLKTNILPSGNFTEFVSINGGTFEYYDLPVGTSLLGSGLSTYNNLTIANKTATSFTLVQNNSITVNGSLFLLASSSGNLTYQLSNSAGAKSLSIGGNLLVSAGCSLTVGTDNAAHNLSIAGNVTNSGFIRLTNAATASTTPSNGYCNATFTGAVANTVFQCNAGSQTRFHNLINQKNTGYELLVQADAGVSPQFWSGGRNLDPQSGTLRLGSNVLISPLGDLAGNFDIGSSTTIPTLWIDGATVDWGGSNSIVGYGTLRVSAGTLNVGSGASSIVLREAGQFILEGGTVNAQMFRTSITATTHRGSYIQTGGRMNLNVTTGSPLAGYSVLTLPYAENVFKMSGGVINITRLSASLVGGIQIGSTAENFDVTGGTLNITTTSNLDFDISSIAPFYNVTISRALGSTASVRLASISGVSPNVVSSPQPLTVLNDFTITSTNSPVFNSQNSNVLVGGNLTLNSGATWQSSTNTLVFNGTGAQTFTVNGTLGLSSLQVNKLNGSTLTLAGSVSAINLTGGLLLNKGVLADAGKTINVVGDIFNEASHSGTGKIVMNGSAAAQAITGTSTAVFGNLELSNSFGSAGSTQISSSTNIRINGNLTLSTDRLFSVGKYEVSLSGTSLISGSFSASRHISTNGLRSDAGIKKTFSSTTAFVFPFGSAGNYTPATIQFASAPSTWGTLDVRPAATKQLYVTNPDAFDLYWRIKTTGFSGIPANSVNYTFGYGSLADNASYIPAYYNDASIAYTSINDVSKVDEAANTILFQNVSYTDGDYTAGNPAAFGIVVPFYSRSNGNWSSPSTWSNVGFGGAAASSVPSSNSPVLIGNGSTQNHTVTVTANGTISGSLIVDAGSVLDLQATTGNNFGAIPYATAGGSGKIKISSASGQAVFPAGDFGLFFLAAGGTTEFYSTGSQDFRLPSVTDAPNAINIDTYRNLTVNPGAGRVISLPEKNLLVYGNLDLNGSNSGRVRLPNASSRTQTIKGNLNVNSGILEFSPAFAQTINLEGNASVLSNGTMQSVDTGAVVHTLAMSKNMLNEGSILFNQTSKVNMRFQSDSARVFNGSNPSANLQIGKLQVNMGTSAETTFDITTKGTLSAPNDNWLTITKGTLKISRSGNLTLTSSASNFTIPAAGGLILNNSALTITVGDVNSASADLILGGNLYVLAGTLNVGNSLYNQNNDLEYANSGFPEFKVSGNGAVNINGQIRRSINTQQGALVYTQQDNSAVLIRGKNTDVATSQTYDRAKLEILNTGSQFNMSGNSTLTIDRSGNPSGVFFDVYLQPSSSSITGGTITFGTSSTPASQNFYLNNTVPLWALVINGSVNPKTLTLNGNPLVLQDDLQILGSSVLVASGQNVTVGGDFVNQNPTSTAGLAVGGFQPGNSNQITTLNGSLASQSITGSGTNLTNFANLVLNNTASSPSINLASNSALRVIGNLEINSGQFNTGANLVTVTGNLVNNGGHSSTGAGFLVMAGSNQQFISSSGTANFGSLRITNAAGVDASAPLNLSGNLNLTTGIFYISNHSMTLSATSAVTGSFSPACMIRLNGVASDAGVTRAYPASASDFTFPIGVTLKYTPVRVNVTSNTTAGSVTIKPINTRHPGTTDTLDKELLYYWKMSASGFSGSTVVSHTFTYTPDDASNGTESSYVTGRFLSGLWAPTQGIAGTVSPAADQFTLTSVNYFEGDFTAGEPSEFNILTTFYSRSASSGGNWNDPNSWSNDAVLKHAGAASVTYPNFNQVVIDSAHTITVTGDGYNAVTVDLKGVLDLGNTLSHNFGTVSGTGKVILRPTTGAQFIFPGGDFSSFVDSAGGTFEFSGNTNGTLPTQATYNHLLFSGSGTKNMPNADVRVKGNFALSSGAITNSSNRKIYLRKNWSNLVGSAGFNAGTGTVILEGGTQSISGSTTFANLTLASAGDKTLVSSITLTRALTLTAGNLVTAANQVTVNATGSVSGGSSTSFVKGTLRRGVVAASPALTFPVGDAAGFAPFTLSFTGSTTAGGFITASTTGSEHPNIYTSGVHPTKNTNRYWTLSNSGVGGFTAYGITLNHLPAELDPDAVPASFVVARNASSSWTLPTTGSVTSTSVQATGITGTTFGDFVAGVGIGGKVWTGNISSDWNTGANWTPVGVPTLTENTLIGPTLNQPGFLSGASGVCKSLYLLSGAGIDIPSGYQLSVGLDAEATGNTISGAGLLKVTGSSTLKGTLNVNSNLEVVFGASLTFTTGSVLNLGRNLSVIGSMNPGTAQVNMVGGINSTVSGNAAFYNLGINKSSGQNSLQLLSNISVSNNLDMQSGDILLNGKDLDLGSTGSLLNESDSNRVGGPGSGSIRASRLLNAPSGVNVAGLGVTITSAVNLGSTQVIRRHDQIVYGLGFGINRRVEIHPTNNAALDATLTMSYYESELNTPLGLNPENDLDLWRFNGSNWDKQSGTLNMAANTVTKTGIPQFSEWIIASEINAPLALNLAYARVDCELSGPVLRWKSLDGKEDDIVSIEISNDGSNWNHLHRVLPSDRTGNGFAFSRALSSGVDYGKMLRLKVLRADGSEDYSSPIPVLCSGGGKMPEVLVSPNPGNGLFRLEMTGGTHKVLGLRVCNSLGQVVFVGNSELDAKAGVSLDLRNLPAGMYRLQVSGDGGEGSTSWYSLVIQ